MSRKLWRRSSSTFRFWHWGSRTEKHHETASAQQGPFLWILPWDMPRIDVYACRIHKQFKTIIEDILLWSLPFLQWERDKSWVPLMSNLKSKGHARTLCTNSQAILLPWREKEEWIKRRDKEEQRVRTAPQKISSKMSMIRPKEQTGNLKS